MNLPGGGPDELSGRRRPVSWGLVAVARLYQLTLSRLLGGHCKFQPTCSEYFIEAVTRKGALCGTAAGLWRILRCNPFSHGGYDPIDKRRNR